MHSFINSYKNSSAEGLFFFSRLTLQRLSYLFLHDSLLHVFTSPRSHSHSWFQCFVTKFTSSLIKKPITLLWFWKGWWFSNRNYSVTHLFTSKRRGVLKREANMLVLLAIEKFLLRYLSVPNQQHKACYSTQIRYLFSVFMIYEFIWSGMVQKSLFQTSFPFHQESWSLSSRRLLAAKCNLFSFVSVNICRINQVENCCKGFWGSR